MLQHRPGYEQARNAFKTSLERLGLDYVDLYLIHWPVPSQDKYVETWKAFIELQAEGLVRAIGVSNFQPDHLRRIIDETGVTPAVNQVELHPRLQQAGLRREHADRGIVTEAWSPLAQGAVLDDPVDERDRATSTTRRPARSSSAGTSSSATWCSRSRSPRRGSRRTSTSSASTSPNTTWQAIEGLDAGERTGPDPDTFAKR